MSQNAVCNHIYAGVYRRMIVWQGMRGLVVLGGIAATRVLIRKESQ
jgi:hypothetical protein